MQYTCQFQALLLISFLAGTFQDVNAFESVQSLERTLDKLNQPVPFSEQEPRDKHITPGNHRMIVGAWKGIGRWRNFAEAKKVSSRMIISQHGKSLEVRFQTKSHNKVRTMPGKLIQAMKMVKSRHKIVMVNKKGEKHQLIFNKNFSKVKIHSKNLFWQGRKQAGQGMDAGIEAEKTNKESGEKKNALFLAKGLKTHQGKRLYGACVPYFEKNIFTRDNKKKICECFGGLLGKKRLTEEAIRLLESTLEYGIKIKNKKLARIYASTLLGCQDLVETNSL